MDSEMREVTPLNVIEMNSTQFMYVSPVSSIGTIISAIIILTLMVIGVFANTLTIIVITTCKELSKSLFMRFILSLSVADLISSLISWLFLYRRTWGFNDWRLPDFLCKSYWGVDMTTSFVTALHILSFSIYRYMSIQHTYHYKRITLLHGNIWMVCMWFVCICSALIPCFFIFGAAERNRTIDSPYSRWPACTALADRYEDYILFQRITYTVFFYFPTVGVIATCTAILIIVEKKSRQMSSTSAISNKRKQKERNAIRQLLLIILSFLFGYIPFTSYEFWSVGQYPNNDYYRDVDYWFGMTGYICLRLSECLNPLFYNIGSPLVHKHSVLFIKTKLCCWFSKEDKNSTPFKVKSRKKVPPSVSTYSWT